VLLHFSKFIENNGRIMAWIATIMTIMNIAKMKLGLMKTGPAFWDVIKRI
jgi:hypothetical protein